MNWIGDMNKTMAYIEENITKDIQTEDVAKTAHVSKFHFLRIFLALTGMTLGDYIRQRRLSLAAKDILEGQHKIIDIACKYGYETPEAFTKAFKKVHGISPMKARQSNAKLKAIPPITFQIEVKGERQMDYRIDQKESFNVKGISKQFSTKEGNNFKEVPKFWDEICESGKYTELEKRAGKLGVLGICYDFDKEYESVNYMIGIEEDEKMDYEKLNIPACTWAVFESIGPLPGAIQKVFHKIYAEWFPATGYEHAGSPELEVYLPGDSHAEDYKCEVWIPIIRK